MTTTKVDPLQLREPLGEFLFNMLQAPFEDVCPTLAMTMTMEAADVSGQLFGQLVGRDAKAGAWGTGIIQEGAHL